MKNHLKSMSRRDFLASTGAIAGTALITPSELNAEMLNNTINTVKKTKIALIGTGSRGCGMWGQDLVKRYPDLIEFVGLCDINPGRLAFAKEYIGVTC
ncbi:MAG: twin-arginine translocation signal domain-containing protein, partial [Massilibacteroides sp.]|nr:twin-arginine translocation signal domain-containing protein [Massilibacteroides sp.]